MKAGQATLFGLILCGTIAAFSCTRPYEITRDLQTAVDDRAGCSIDKIGDALPAGFDEEDKPTLEHIDKFKDYLKTELEKKGVFHTVGLLNPDAEYAVTGRILDYEKGSGAARFFFGFGAGKAKLTVALKLKDRRSRTTLFAGNFTATVSSWLESGDDAFWRVARDFAKELKKQLKKLRKQG